MGITGDLRTDFANMYDTSLNHGDFALTHLLCVREAAFKTPFGVVAGVDQIVDLIKRQRSAFEAFSYRVDFIFASPQGVGVVSTTKGRHVGELFGIPPTGEWIQAQGLSIHRIVDGRSIGGWTCTPLVNLLRKATKRTLQAGG